MKLCIPTRVYMSDNAVFENADIFKLGKKALIVTGKSSGKKSGALDDVTDVLKKAEIEYAVFDKVENNPTPENCYEGGKMAKSEKADFIIGIGGGSPLDAAKAIAVYATNEIDVMEVYDNAPNKALPIIAIPTTAGTGSEVTPYSVLTVNYGKQTLKRDDIYPYAAFLDEKYTSSLTPETALNTGFDALSHVLESLFCKSSDDISEMYAKAAMKHIYLGLTHTRKKDPGKEVRNHMLLGSMLAGAAIAHSGTTVVHLLGYNLTCYKDIHHGLANGYLLVPFLEKAQQYAFEKCREVAPLFGGSDRMNFLIGVLKSHLPEKLNLSEEEIEKFTKICVNNPKINSAVFNLTEADVREMYGAI